MDKYTVYCTEEQTKKAFKLGAPIDFKCNMVHYLDGGYSYEIEEKDGEPVLETPTAEQMIGWLDNQDICIDITMASKKTSYYTLTRLTDIGSIYIKGRSENDYASRKEATLAAIDAALDYLIKIKRNRLCQTKRKHLKQQGF